MMMARNSSNILKSTNAHIAKLALETDVELGVNDIDDRKVAFFHGMMFFHGFGVAKDYNQAFKKFSVRQRPSSSFSLSKAASRSGIPEAYMYLGSMYEHGQGVTADLAIAYKM
jgi:TPR repeat protein